MTGDYPEIEIGSEVLFGGKWREVYDMVYDSKLNEHKLWTVDPDGNVKVMYISEVDMYR